MSPSLAELTAEIRARIAALGYELVDLRKSGTSQRVRLQLRLDHPDAAPGHGITVDQCADVSRALEQWLDQTGILGPRYILEVSSPGIERPVRWPEHWARFIGRDVRVRLPEHGRTRAKIIAVGEAGETVTLRLPSGETGTWPLEQARDATLAVEWDGSRPHRPEANGPERDIPGG
jgi:ribosome maturation factor RimP